MKKKIYRKPEMKAYQVKTASIICTSGSLKQNEASFEGYQDGTFSWDGGSVKEQRDYSNSVKW